MLRLILLLALQSPNVFAARTRCEDMLLQVQTDTKPVHARRINFTLSGREHPQTLVLIHGLGSNLETFDGVVDELSKHFNVLRYDTRGHGRTPHNSTNFSPEIQARDLQGLLDALGLRSVTLLGHSMGGRTAMAFAGLFPDRTDRLIIEDMEVQPRTQQDIQEYLENGRASVPMPLDYASQQEAMAILEPFFGENTASFVNKGHWDDDGRFVLRLHPSVHFFARIQGNHADVRPLLKTYRGPIFVLKADRGSIITRRGLQIWRDEFPRVIVRPIKGSQHNIHKSRRTAFLNAVIEFMNAPTR